jgi:hypothetical protein
MNDDNLWLSVDVSLQVAIFRSGDTRNMDLHLADAGLTGYTSSTHFLTAPLSCLSYLFIPRQRLTKSVGREIRIYRVGRYMGENFKEYDTMGPSIPLSGRKTFCLDSFRFPGRDFPCTYSKCFQEVSEARESNMHEYYI